MNDDRRKVLKAILDTIADIQNDLQDVFDEEEEAFHSMPDGVKASDRGQTSEAAVEALEGALTSIAETFDYVNEAVGA